MQIFEEFLFFKLCTTTTEKKNKQLIQLILCQLDVGGWRKEKGTRLTQERGLPRKCARFVLFRLIEKRSFNLLCVLDLFFTAVAVSSVSDFFFTGINCS